MSANSHKRTLAVPKEVEHWSMTTMREKLVKIGAKIVRHGRSSERLNARTCSDHRTS